MTAWVLRFVKNIKSKITIIKLPYLNNDELEYSKKLWLLANEKELLISDRFRDLQNLLRLELFDDAFYRSKGRLSYGKLLPYSLKEPILLKRDHFLTRLIVWDAHLKVKHNGEPFKVIYSYLSVWATYHFVSCNIKLNIRNIFERCTA